MLPDYVIFFYSYGFTQHVTEPTHRRGHLLDLLLARTDLTVKMSSIDPPLLSDHSFVIADISLPPVPTQPVVTSVRRQWRDLDLDAFVVDLMTTDLVQSPPEDTEVLFDCYDQTLRILVNKHVPLVVRRHQPRPSSRWFDADCRAAKRMTRKLERRYRRLCSSDTLASWREQFQLQRQLFQSKFTAFWHQTITTNRHDPRALWRSVNSLMKVPDLPTNTAYSANDFARHFHLKVSNIRDATSAAQPPDIQSRSVPRALSTFTPVTDSEIKSLLSSCPTKSSVLDPVPTWLLKRLADFLAPTIAYMCNQSLTSGIFPSSHQHAIVFPRLKKASLDPDSLSSYRPISNLSFISKVVERTVASRFNQHAATHQLLPVNQSAYRRYHSTESALLSVHNDLVRSLDNGDISCLLLLDLSSAFDTVDHPILCSVLQKRFAVTDTCLDWFSSYLTGRTQSVSYANKQTQPVSVDCSVPQGSVLGPLQFIAYTDDIAMLFAQHNVRFHLFADDKQVYACGRVSDVDTIRKQLSDCAADVSAWCSSRRLQLNASKTELIWFGSRSNLSKLSGHDLSVSVGPVTIQPVGKVRDLGVIFDSELSMKQHISLVTRTCFYHIRRLRQVRRRAGQEVTTQLVLALVMSRLDYCNSLYAGLPQSTIEPLQHVQNAAARLIFDLRPRDHITSCLLQLHWLPIKFRIIYKLCILMYSVRVGNCPQYLTDMVQPLSSQPRRSGLRSSDSSNFAKPRLRTKFGERAFSFSGPHAWNTLPESIRAADSFTSFKRLLKTHLFFEAFNVV